MTLQSVSGFVGTASCCSANAKCNPPGDARWREGTALTADAQLGCLGGLGCVRGRAYACRRVVTDGQPCGYTDVTQVCDTWAMRWRLPVALALATVLASACDGSTDPVEQACADDFDAHLRCNRLGLAPKEVDRVRPRYILSCVTRFRQFGHGASQLESLRACAEALNNGRCPNRAYGSRIPIACHLQGELADGASCATDSSCKSGVCRRVSNGDLCGKCASVPSVGEECNSDEYLACGWQATCSQSTTPATCMSYPRGELGESCLMSGCKLGLYCSLGTTTCERLLPDGAPCTMDRECLGAARCLDRRCTQRRKEHEPCADFEDCGDGLECDRETSKCIVYRRARGGEPCGEKVRCVVGYCNFNETTGEGTCPEVMVDGQPCDPNDVSRTCDTFASCTNGKCSFEGKRTCQ
jgi:hypothetical protein